MGIYVVVGIAWILLGDRLLPRHQTLKGLLFVFGTGALIWLLLDRAWRQRMELMERHRQTQRLQSLGHVVGDIAHDFNNIITAIRGYTDLLLARFGPGTPEHEDLQQVRAASDRAVSLTRQLLAFGRRGPLEPVLLDLNEVVVSTLRLAEPLLPASLEVVNSLDESLGPVRGDPGKLEEVLMSLLTNARDALDDRGQIGITTAHRPIDRDRDHPGRIHIPAGEYALLQVSDDGPGMDRDTLNRAFEPFFTTRDRAMGLGLSTAYGIVKQHDGYIFATSEPSKGTTIHIYLPVAAEADEADAPGAWAPETSPARATGERILVVDDDDGSRTVVARILREAGYEVDEADRPGAALQRLEDEGTGFDLVITDLVMPELDGEELVSRIQRTVPGTRVLLMTGHPSRAGSVGDYPLIEKPPDPGALLAEVRALLSRR